MLVKRLGVTNAMLPHELVHTAMSRTNKLELRPWLQLPDGVVI